MWVVGLVAACLMIVLWPNATPWSAVGLVVSGLVLWHTFAVSRRVPWFPGIIASIAAVQWILAALYVYHDSTDAFATGAMAVSEGAYFAFAVPSFIVMILGLCLPLRGEVRAASTTARRNFAMSGSMRIACETMVWGGIALRLAVPLMPTSLRFAVLLLSQLAYVGAFAELLAAAPRWWLRVGLMLLLEFLFCARAGSFLGVLQWGICSGVLVVYRFRPRTTLILAGAAGGLLLVGALNVFKHLYRNDILGSDMSDAERTEATSEQLTGILANPSSVMSAQSIAVNVARLNQGQLTSWVLAWVPLGEPFAKGETIETGIRAAILPRVLDPGKYVAGGSEYFERFTGKRLLNGTSMNLSIPGEMYANFGYAGGIIGVFVYSLVLGFLFRLFFRWARRSPLWWAWVPLVFLNALSAEDGFGEGINRLSKALVVTLAFAYFEPAWRKLRPGVAGAKGARKGRVPVLPPSAIPAPGGAD